MCVCVCDVKAPVQTRVDVDFSFFCQSDHRKEGDLLFCYTFTFFHDAPLACEIVTMGSHDTNIFTVFQSHWNMARRCKTSSSSETELLG